MPRSATWGRHNSNNNQALILQRRPCAEAAGAFSSPAAAPQTRALPSRRQRSKCRCRGSRLAQRSSLFLWWRTSFFRNSTTQQMQLSRQVNAQQGRDLQCTRGKTTTSQQQSDHTFGCLIWILLPLRQESTAASRVGFPPTDQPAIVWKRAWSATLRRKDTSKTGKGKRGGASQTLCR